MSKYSYGNVDWYALLEQMADRISAAYKVDLILDEVIVAEIACRIEDSLNSLGAIQPNAAKIAGQAAFWIRKLKPLSMNPSSKNYFRFANERAALSIGLAICNKYKDDTSKANKIKLPARVFHDWVIGFRYHSHSPYSAMTSFELLMCEV